MSEGNHEPKAEKQRPYSWLAVASFVVALMPFFLAIWLNISDRIAYVLSICGAVFAVVVAIWMMRTQQRGGGFVIVAFVLCVLPLIIFPPLSRARDLSNRAQCSRFLEGIGREIYTYQADYDGCNPPTLDVLVSHDMIPPSLLDCPVSEVPPGELSYIYRGCDLDGKAAGDMILIYEKPGNHGRDLFNVLYADGRVECHPEVELWELIDRDNALRREMGIAEKAMEVRAWVDREGNEIKPQIDN